MINAADLRLGNWVHHTKEWSTINNGPFDTPGFDFQWDERHWYMLGECTLSLDVIEPIPLSAEWLERFAFVKKGDFFFVDENFVIENMIGGPYWSIRLRVTPETSQYLRQIKFVHEMQNVIYALWNLLKYL